MPIHETFEGELVWAGHVQVFDLSDHPSCQLAYAWSHEVNDNGRRRFYAVLHTGPIKSALDAVRGSIAADWQAEHPLPNGPHDA